MISSGATLRTLSSLVRTSICSIYLRRMGKIGTHNGKFHCDEAFACFMLKKLPQFKDHEIIRTRDAEVLATCNVVVDVGGIYDHEKKRYDHHQKEFTETMQTLNILDFNTKLSSAGLVYAHYGKDVIAQVLGIPIETPLVNILYRKLYESFVEQIDAVDNGIPQFDGTPRYHTTGGISGRVGRLNPHWNDLESCPDERFSQAMQEVGGEFVSTVEYLHNVWWPAREIVEKAIENRLNIDDSGRIILIENGGVPWKEHFFTLEEENGLQASKICYILFEDSTGKNWRIQAIPTNSLSQFDNRMPLPKAWRSLRDDQLSEASGIPGGVFVHTSGFIGGNVTREGVIAMARKAIEIGDAEGPVILRYSGEMHGDSHLEQASGNVCEKLGGVLCPDRNYQSWSGNIGLRLAQLSSATPIKTVGAVVYLRRKEREEARREMLMYEIERLKNQVDILLRDIAILSSPEISPSVQKKVTIRDDHDSESDLSDAVHVEDIATTSCAPSNDTEKLRSTSPVLTRATSYQSITSDADYVDAEEEWDNGTVTIPCLSDSSQPSVTIPVITTVHRSLASSLPLSHDIMSFDDVDKLFGTDAVESGYNTLKKRNEAEPKNVEILWRLGKFCHEMSSQTSDKARRKELLFEGRTYAVAAHDVNDKCFMAVKWAAIMTGSCTDFLGTKEKIEQGSKFKQYLDKALAMDAKEFTLLHLRGRYAFSVASLSWLERKAAALFFATPPVATMDEAIVDFLGAFEVRPDWIENLLYLGRAYHVKGDKANAKTYLNKVLASKPADANETEMQNEAKKLVAKC